MLHREPWLRRRLANGDALTLPGVFDALSAMLAARCGAQALYAGGFAATAAQHGLPDLGLLGFAEMAEIYERIHNATQGLPLVVDADTGHGGLLNVQRTVCGLAAIGVSACHIEDQVSPKRCGHLAGKDVVDRETAVARVAAAVEAGQATGVGIIARTDALAVHDFDEAIVRAQAFLAVGADAIFIDAPKTREQIAAIPRLIDGPALFNAATTGVAPVISTADLAAMGYRIIIHPIQALVQAANAISATISEMLGLQSHPPIDFTTLNVILGAQSALDTEARLSEPRGKKPERGSHQQTTGKEHHHAEDTTAT